MANKIYLSPAAHGHDNPCSFDRNCGENVHCNLYMDELETILKACAFEVKRNSKGCNMNHAISDSNAWGADLHYVAHTNAGGGSYSLLMAYDSGKGWKYAEAIKAERAKVYGKNIQIRSNPSLGELCRTKAIAVYDELVFHDNAEDIAWLHNHFRDMAMATAKAMCNIFGVAFKDPYAVSIPVEKPSCEFNVGDKVRLKSGVTTYADGNGIAAFVSKAVLFVRQINGDKVLISTQQSGDVTGWVRLCDIVRDDGATPVAPAPAPVALAVGDRVRIRDGVAKFANGANMASFIRSAVLYVRQIGSGKVLISTQASGAVTGWAKTEDVVKM